MYACIIYNENVAKNNDKHLIHNECHIYWQIYKISKSDIFVFTWKYILLHKVINRNKEERNGNTIIILFSISQIKRKLGYPLLWSMRKYLLRPISTSSLNL